MAHPDSIKVVVEDAANIAVTSAPAIGNVSVTADTPAVIAINTNSAQITLAELIGGNPQDGQVIVFDATTNTFIYDYSSGGAGNLISDLDVTNRSTGLGDAISESYEANDSQEGILRDILAPKSPVITNVSFRWNKAGEGTVLPAGRFSSLSTFEVDFMFPERLGSGSWPLYVGGGLVAQTSQLPSDYGDSSRAILSMNYSIQGASGDIVPFELRSTYDDNGVDRSFSYEGSFYFSTPSWISCSPDGVTEGSVMSNIIGDIIQWSAPFSNESDSQYVTLKGSSETQSDEKFTWIAIPSDYMIDSITEVVGGAGVANRTYSFFRFGGAQTYQTLSESYSVYLYRSNQAGALSAESSLRIKLNRS
jgi:hypothetical protein